MNEKPITFGGSAMDTQIFNQGLSVHATSAYIIIASLQTDGMRPSLLAIRNRWNAGPEHLEEALAELKAYNIVERHRGTEDSGPIYIVNPASLWGKEGLDF